MLGITSDSSHQMGKMSIQEGGKLLLFTDGLLEHIEHNDADDKEKGIVDILQQSQKKSIQEVVKSLSPFPYDQSTDHKGVQLKDDTTILGVELPYRQPPTYPEH